MSISVYNKLEEKIEDLKEVLRGVNTESLLGTVANEIGITIDTRENIFEKTGLHSPFKQYLYLMGMLLATKSDVEDSKEQLPMGKIKQLLNEIVELYVDIFSPSDEEKLDGNWLEVTKISMPVFLDYFNTNPLTYEEQTMERIRDWFQPYSEYIKEEIGCNVEELINIFKYIKNNLQERFDNLTKLRSAVLEEQKTVKKYMKNNNATFEQAFQQLAVPNIGEFIEQITLIHHIEVEDLVREFGTATARSFVNTFSIVREDRDFFYYTAKNPFESAPMWRKSEQLLFVPIYLQIIHAIQIKLTALIEGSPYKASFYKNRDKRTEEKTEEIFRNFLQEEATYHNSLFENDKSQNEHDLIIEWNDNLLIVEIKASKVKEPFRNPQQAYERIKRDFRNDGGIQKAYNQGLNLKKLILQNEMTPLYNDKGQEIVCLKRDEIKKIYIIVVTAEKMGILAANLSFLLEKPEEEPYPWATNLFDLETAFGGLLYKKYEKNAFLDYLNQREVIHEHLFSTDELEIFGYYLQGGNLESLTEDKQTLVMFAPEYSFVFDDIYYEKKGIVTNEDFFDSVEFSDYFNKRKSYVKDKRKTKRKRRQAKKSRKINRKK